MITREQAIQAEAEKSIYQDEDGIYRSRFGGIGSTSFKQSSDRAAFRLTDGIVFLEAAERVRAAMDPTKIVLLNAEIIRLNHVRLQNCEEIRRLETESRQLNAKVTEAKNKSKEIEEQHEVDKQVIAELEGVIAGLRGDVANREKEIARLTKEAEAVKPQAAEPAEKSDPSREVTWGVNGARHGTVQ